MDRFIDELLKQEYLEYFKDIGAIKQESFNDDEGSNFENTALYETVELFFERLLNQKTVTVDGTEIIDELSREVIIKEILEENPMMIRAINIILGLNLQNLGVLDYYESVPSMFCNDRTLNEEFLIPKCIKKIEDYAFCFCDNLLNVIIENSDTVVSPKAFYGCNRCTFIEEKLPKSVTDDKVLAVSLKYFALKKRREKKEIEVIDHSFIDYDGSSKEVFDTPLYKDYIENELSKFYAEFVSKYEFIELFSSFRGSRTLSKLGFLSHEDMKKYDQYFDTSVKRSEMVEKAKDIVKRIDERDNDKYSGLKEALNDVIDGLSKGSNDIDYKTIQQKLYEQYRILLYTSKNRDKSIDADLLDDVKEVIEDISYLPMNIVNCLGVYDRDLDEILLCLDNIFNDKTLEEIIKKKNVWDLYDTYLLTSYRLFSELTESVLIHEYTHYLHWHATEENALVRVDNFEIRTVKETIAETLQKIFIVKKNVLLYHLYNVEEWIYRHSTSGLFPGWPYAGENVLENRVQSERCYIQHRTELLLQDENELGKSVQIDKYDIEEEKKLVDLLIEVSCKSYKTAYDLLMIFAGK